MYFKGVCVVYLLKEKWSSWFELRRAQEFLTVNDYLKSHTKVWVAHAARIVTHHLVYGQVSLAQWLFFADRGIDWYRVSTHDWSIFCATFQFAFFFVHFVAFIHHCDVLTHVIRIYSAVHILYFRRVSTKILKLVYSRTTTLGFINLCKTNLC